MSFLVALAEALEGWGLILRDLAGEPAAEPTPAVTGPVDHTGCVSRQVVDREYIHVGVVERQTVPRHTLEDYLHRDEVAKRFVERETVEEWLTKGELDFNGQVRKLVALTPQAAAIITAQLPEPDPAAAAGVVEPETETTGTIAEPPTPAPAEAAVGSSPPQSVPTLEFPDLGSTRTIRGAPQARLARTLLYRLGFGSETVEQDSELFKAAKDIILLRAPGATRAELDQAFSALEMKFLERYQQLDYLTDEAARRLQAVLDLATYCERPTEAEAEFEERDRTQRSAAASLELAFNNDEGG